MQTCDLRLKSEDSEAESSRVCCENWYTAGVSSVVRHALLLLTIALTAAGQEPLLSIAEVNRILTTPTETAERTVTFRGVVNLTVPALKVCTVQQDQAGIFVRVPEGATAPSIGDVLEVRTSAKFESTDPDTTVNPQSIRIVGHREPPEPIRASSTELFAGKFNRLAVEMEGVVLQTRFWDDTWILHLVDADGWITGIIYSWPEGWAPPQEWLGATVRFRGADVGRGPRALRASSASEVQVIKPGAADPFAAPLVSAGQFRQSGVSTGERLRLRGTVLAQTAGTVFLRDQGVPFQADFLYPFDVFDRSRPRLLPPPVPVLRTGDQVELVGSPRRSGTNLVIRYSSMRVLGPGDALAPVSLSSESLANGTFVNDLIRTTGRLLSREQVNTSNGIVETLHVDTDVGMMQAALESRSGGAFESLRVNDRVELTGLLIATGTQPLYAIRILQGSDVRAMGLDPGVSRQRLLRLGGVAIAAVMAVLVWARMLRGQVASRTAELAEANNRLNVEIEERSKAQAELDRALAAERELGELKSRFVALVSHEFRTPLGITMSAVELLRHYGERLSPEKLKELHNDIHAATLRMSGLMEQVLVLGRVEAGKIPFNAVPVDLSSMAEKLVDEIHSATDARCRIEFRALNDLKGANADEGLLRHILSNLLSNAVKYSPDGKPVDFTIERQGDSAVFSVRDHGIGIPELDQARLFEAFHRAGNVGETPGTGLGLLIVKRCVDMHHGSISLHSSEGNGSTFTVSLPLYNQPVE